MRTYIKVNPHPNRKDTPHEFYKLILQPFEDMQIEKYLSKRYSKTDYYAQLSVYLFDTLHKEHRKIFRNPLLLSFAKTLVDEKDGQGKMVKYSYDIYHTIVNEWLRREHKSGITPAKLREFCEELALKIQ